MTANNNSEAISINIEVDLESLDNLKSLFGSTDNVSSIEFCDGEVELKLLPVEKLLSFEGGSTAELIITFSVGVASGVVGNIIFAYLCGLAKKLRLNGRRTRIAEESITQVIETTKVTIVESKKTSIIKNNKDITN